MHPSTRCKRLSLLLLSLLMAAILTGCATIPPQQITGIQPNPTAGQADNTMDETAGDGQSIPAATATPAPLQTASLTALEAEAPTSVELFYSGMPSMMGFADASQTTIYESTMDALSACVSLCWPMASTTYYRYSTDMAKERMQLTQEQLLARVGDPSFYRDTPLFQQPDRLKREGLPLETEPENMNEPVPSFWEITGAEAPSTRSAASGTPVAIANTAPESTSLSIIVTDLHELRMDDGRLLDALNERGLQLGRTVGVAAIVSEFAGYIPDLGSNSTTFVWGAPPSGTLDYVLDYTEYKVGISIDPEQREMASRPFYVLVLGDQAAVSTYLATLEERLTREFSASGKYQFRTAVFGSGYVLPNYTIAGNMRYTAGQGVTAVADTQSPAGVGLIELKASQEARYLQWQVSYKIHPSDPRATSLTAEDFTFAATARGDTESVNLPDLTWSLVQQTGDTLTIQLHLDLPQGVLVPGSYQLELAGSLSAPSTLPGSDWLSQFGYDADGTQLFEMEQNQTEFDGSRTLYLSRLIDTLGKANLSRLGIASLGAVSIALTVYA